MLVRSNRPLMPAEARILHDAARDFGSDDAELEGAGALVEHGFRDHLGEHLAVEPRGRACSGVTGRPDLAAELLQPVLIESGGTWSTRISVPPTLATVDLTEAAEDVADAPDAEADGDQAEKDAHDDAPEPIGGGFMNTSKHGSDLLIGNSDLMTADGRNIRIADPLATHQEAPNRLWCGRHRSANGSSVRSQWQA